MVPGRHVQQVVGVHAQAPGVALDDAQRLGGIALRRTAYLREASNTARRPSSTVPTTLPEPSNCSPRVENTSCSCPSSTSLVSNSTWFRSNRASGHRESRSTPSGLARPIILGLVAEASALVVVPSVGRAWCDGVPNSENSGPLPPIANVTLRGPVKKMPMSGAEIHPLVGDLLASAIADPGAAEAGVRELLATSNDPAVLSVARQASGIVLRHRGLMVDALRELHAAVRLARRSDDVNREADARATLGVTLALAGRTRSGLVQLERGLAAATDPVVVGQDPDASRTRAALLPGPGGAGPRGPRWPLAALRAAGDRVWEARTLNIIGGCRLALGQVGEAEAAIREAEAIFTDEGQRLEAVITLHNRGSIAFRQGDLPRALRLFDLAGEGVRRAGHGRGQAGGGAVSSPADGRARARGCRLGPEPGGRRVGPSSGAGGAGPGPGGG